MKVRIGRDFYDKRNDRIYAGGEIATVNKEIGLWIVRNNLGHVIPTVRYGRHVSINNNRKGKAKTKNIEGPPEDRMMKKENINKK